MNVADSAMLPLSWYSGFALVLISEYEESELFVEAAEGTEASFGGLLPVDASVEIEELAYDAVDGCDYTAAFSLYPTSMDQLIRVADAGQMMPPKSTWFEPKLRDALTIHLIGDEQNGKSL